MGFFDRFKKQTESVRIAPNDENTLHINTGDLDKVYDQIVRFDTTQLNNFRLLKGERNDKYNSYDLMAQDSRVSSILNMYADDCTQYNQSGKVIWAESSDPNCADFVNRLIDILQLNKYAWNHIYLLCRYGDLYLELFYDDENLKKSTINDSPNDIKSYAPEHGSRLLERIEVVRNPASIFDLIDKGKTVCFVKVQKDEEHIEPLGYLAGTTHYASKDKTNIVLPANKYIHISLNDVYTRFPNKYVLIDNDSQEEIQYDVKEGTSILANVFKVWSELNLLEDSVLLNRLSKSAIIRLIQVEVGNTDDNDVREILLKIRDKISRTRYLDSNAGEYKNQVNPGPVENIIYNATHEGKGNISHSVIGGDVDVKALADLDHFLEKFALSFPIPLAYVKQCLRGNTKILLANGEMRTIQYLYNHKEKYINTKILTCDINGHESITNIKDIEQTRKDANYVRVYLNNETFVDVTPDHKFLLKNGNFILAEKLNVGDKLMSIKYQNCTPDIFVEEVSPLFITEDAYDLTVNSNNHTFSLANGIYVHNSNDDGGGLSAGTSLTKFDAHYGRTLKRCQNAYIYGITDLINVFAYEKNLTDYINKFTIKMVSPSAVEDNERDEKIANHTQSIQQLMDIFDRVGENAYSIPIKKELINYLMTTRLEDMGLSDILQDDLAKTKNKENDEDENKMIDEMNNEMPNPLFDTGEE